MKSSDLKLKTIVFILFLTFVFVFVSCKTTDTVTEESEILLEEPQEEVAEEIEIPEQEEVEVIEEIDETEIEEAVSEETAIEEEQIIRSREQALFYTIKYTRDYSKIGYDLDYKITVDDEAKEIIILYEESESDEDWKNNCYVWPWPLKLDGKTIWTTYGYAKIYKSSQDIPFNEFYRCIEEHPDYKIIIRGWSLGSAMAKITARHLCIRTNGAVQIDELTTFGDVKCWLNPFYSLKNQCKRIREYVNSNDLVTWCIPFYRRDVKNKVGDNFSIKRACKSEYHHTHYEECDFSKWEDDLDD